jgi:apolipoprotein N-acyltransferase
VRAVNTGPSAFISATGRVYGRTERARSLDELRAAEPVRAQVALLEGGHTFYARHGNLFASVCCLLVLLGLALERLMAKRTRAMAGAGLALSGR